jgi:hypothetical protein
VNFFERYKGGAIRDGALLAVEQGRALPAWSCDSDAVVAAMEAERSA